MYKILADDTLIYDSTLEDYTITKGLVTKEVNKAGSFVFTIYPEHPYYNRIQRLKTIITVYKGSRIIFRGRVLNDKSGFFKDKTFTCEGELAFLLDSLQRPYTFTGAPNQLFTQYINAHNEQVDEAKQFAVGEVTVTDPNDYITRANSKYESTSANINAKLIDLLGGYLYISRGQEQKAIINYYQDSPFLNGQTIEFGENLLDFVKTNSAEDVVTAIIPLGAKIEGKEGEDDEVRLTISEVNGGKDYLYDPVAVEKYGWIWQTVEYDDVTEAANLLRKGKEYLNEVVKQNITIELKAIDLSLMDKSIDSFELFEYINIISEPHGLKDKLLLQKQTIDLLKPDNDTITLGYTYATFTDKTASQNINNETIIKRVETIESNYAVGTIVASELQNLQSLINQTSESISSEVSSNFVTNDKLISEISTVFTQLKDSFEFMFKILETTVDTNNSDTQTRFNELTKYIRFENGNIVLGSSDSEIVLKIENNKIGFYANDNLVAYFADQKLYVEDAEFINSVKIGKFAFIPRANGNLSFSKVVK